MQRPNSSRFTPGMRPLNIALLVLLVLLQYRVWIGEGSFTAVSRLGEMLDDQQVINEQLRRRNAQLEAEVRDLKEGGEAIEERARRELGMIAADETFFQVVDE